MRSSQIAGLFQLSKLFQIALYTLIVTDTITYSGFANFCEAKSLDVGVCQMRLRCWSQSLGKSASG